MLWNSINLVWMRPRTAKPADLAAVAADEGVDRPLRTAENGLGVLPICVLDMVSVPWNMDGFSERDGLGKKQEIALILEAGLRTMNREHGVDASSTLNACQMTREVGYRNVWVLEHKRPEEEMEAVVTAECVTERTTVTLTVFQKRGQLIRQERVVDLRSGPGGLKRLHLSELLWGGRGGGASGQVRL